MTTEYFSLIKNTDQFELLVRQIGTSVSFLDVFIENKKQYKVEKKERERRGTGNQS